MKFKEAKQHVRIFMQNHYTDERLAMLLAHAQAGRLYFRSCCCFIGIPTADHALKEHYHFDQPHYRLAKRTLDPIIPNRTSTWGLAETAFFYMSPNDSDEVRRRVLIPMIRAEMKWRELANAAVTRGREAEVVENAQCGQADPVES